MDIQTLSRRGLYSSSSTADGTKHETQRRGRSPDHLAGAKLTWSLLRCLKLGRGTTELQGAAGAGAARKGRLIESGLQFFRPRHQHGRVCGHLLQDGKCQPQWGHSAPEWHTRTPTHVSGATIPSRSQAAPKPRQRCFAISPGQTPKDHSPEG